LSDGGVVSRVVDVVDVEDEDVEDVEEVDVVEDEEVEDVGFRSGWQVPSSNPWPATLPTSPGAAPAGESRNPPPTAMARASAPSRLLDALLIVPPVAV